jgi:hypothetical protein
MADDQTREERESDTRSAVLARLGTSHDWQEAKKLLIEKIASATSLLDMLPEERRNPELCEARYQAAQIVGEWISSIDGEVLVHDKLQEAKEDPDHILRIGQP